MPIYEFACKKCGHEFEDLVVDSSPCICPACGSTDTEKMMSASARHKKGDGYADTSYSAPSSGSGCAGCSGGNCASCGH